MDLSRIDFEKLRETFAKSGRKRIEAGKIRGSLEDKIGQMVAQNRTRMDFRERFGELIEKYNNYNINVELLFDEFITMARDLSHEEQRHVRENLSEDELALFDLIIRETPAELSEKRLIVSWPPWLKLLLQLNCILFRF